MGIFGPLWISLCHCLVLFRISVQSRFSFVWVTVTFFSVVVKFLPVCACVCIYLCILRLIAVRVYICSVFGHSFISCFFLGFHTYDIIQASTYDKECPPNTCPVSVCLCLHVHMSMCVGHCDIIQRPDTPRWWSLNIKPMCFYPFISVCMELLWKCLSCLFIVWV